MDMQENDPLICKSVMCINEARWFVDMEPVDDFQIVNSMRGFNGHAQKAEYRTPFCETMPIPQASRKGCITLNEFDSLKLVAEESLESSQISKTWKE